jgi:hypothetical protein
MLKTVYYIEHVESGRRLKYYTTRHGARIAMRTRNLHLGFKERTARLADDAREYELYTILVDGVATTVKGTYCIVEDTMEMEELYTNA